MTAFERDQHSGLLVPRRRRPVMPPGARGATRLVGPTFFGGAATVAPDLIRLMFEGADGSQTFTDEGSAGSVWTPSQAATPKISTTTCVQGASAMHIAGGSEYLYTAYSAGNAIKSGEFFVGLWFRPSGTSASRYVAGVDAVGGTAAGLAWAFYLATGSAPYFFYSDGVTRSSINWATGLTTNTWYYLACERVGNTLYFSVGGTVRATAVFAADLNLPVGGVVYLGATGAGPGVDQPRYDMFQMRRASVYAGGNFTPPTTPIP